MSSIAKMITGLFWSILFYLLSLVAATLVLPDEGILGQIYMLLILVFLVGWWSWEPGK